MWAFGEVSARFKAEDFQKQKPTQITQIIVEFDGFTSESS